MSTFKLNNALVLQQLEGHWNQMFVALMRKQGLKEVEILPEDLEFMIPPYAQTGGKQPIISVIGLDNVKPKGGFLVYLAEGRDEMIDRMAEFQRQNPQTKL